jgi:Na+(H+)/acetate symporter ActP
VAAGLNVPVWVLILVLGLISTAYTFLGGMKAVIWTDVIQSLVMISGVALIIGSVWYTLDDGPARVWQVNQQLGRGEVVDPQFSLSSKWSLWGVLPHFALAMLSFYVADQITAQRYLTAKSLTVARRSFVLNSISVSIMVPGLCYVGMALLAYYHDHPQDVRPKWVVNVDNTAPTQSPNKGKAKTDKSGRPLIDWANDPVDEKTIPRLIAERRLLHPNTGEPLASAEETLDPATGEIAIDRLAKRLPPPIRGTLSHGEIVLNE